MKNKEQNTSNDSKSIIFKTSDGLDTLIAIEIGFSSPIELWPFFHSSNSKPKIENLQM